MSAAQGVPYGVHVQATDAAGAIDLTAATFDSYAASLSAGVAAWLKIGANGDRIDLARFPALQASSCFGSVRLEWDAAADGTIEILLGRGLDVGVVVQA